MRRRLVFGCFRTRKGIEVQTVTMAEALQEPIGILAFAIWIVCVLWIFYRAARFLFVRSITPDNPQVLAIAEWAERNGLAIDAGDVAEEGEEAELLFQGVQNGKRNNSD